MTGKAMKPATITKAGRTASVPISLDSRIIHFLVKSEPEGWESNSPSLQTLVLTYYLAVSCS